MSRWNAFWRRLGVALWEKLALRPLKGRGLSVTLELGSGYSVNTEETVNREKLKEACDRVVVDRRFVMRDITGDGKPETFCNQALWEVAAVMGYELLGERKMSANQIVAHVKESPRFAPVDSARAQALASRGFLVIAALAEDPHGHVAAVHPEGGLVFSGKWGKDCPIVANVGKKNGVIGANYAFAKEPSYHVLDA